jgi:hypothetical protein
MLRAKLHGVFDAYTTSDLRRRAPAASLTGPVGWDNNFPNPTLFRSRVPPNPKAAGNGTLPEGAEKDRAA